MKVPKLQETLKERGINNRGSKKTLRNRIKYYLRQGMNDNQNPQNPIANNHKQKLRIPIATVRGDTPATGTTRYERDAAADRDHGETDHRSD